MMKANISSLWWFWRERTAMGTYNPLDLSITSPLILIWTTKKSLMTTGGFPCGSGFIGIRTCYCYCRVSLLQILAITCRILPYCSGWKSWRAPQLWWVWPCYSPICRKQFLHPLGASACVVDNNNNKRQQASKTRWIVGFFSQKISIWVY